EPRTENREREREPRTPNPEPRTQTLKPLRQILDEASFVPPEVVALARWTAEYYAAGVGDTIPALLPPMARGGRADAHKTTRVAAITAAGLGALAGAQSLPHRQREALEILATVPTGIGTPDLAARGIAADAISRLAKHGYVSVRHDRIERDPWRDVAVAAASGVGATSDPALTPLRLLTGEQTTALERLRKLASAGEFRVALLHGVTGSGK